MHTLQRTAGVLIWSAIACLGAACDGNDAPTETLLPGEEPNFSGSSSGGGGKFYLEGTAELAQDPENSANDVIRIRTDVTPFFGTVSRTVNVKVDQLDNMIEFKSWFQTPKTCIGGAPRVQLAIDLDGDGDSDGNALGYFGPSPAFTGCPPNTWLYEDFTGGDPITGLGPFMSTGQTTPNEEVEWDVSEFVCIAPTLPPGLPGDPCIPDPETEIYWSLVEDLIGSQFPNHLVCTVALVDDARTSPLPFQTGTAYYDLISAGQATWTDRSDSGGRGFAKGCARPDHDDDDDNDDD